MNLDRIFDYEYSPTDLFTDRRTEQKNFERALIAHVERVLADEATLDLQARRNVLTFHGIGGIGKTELSHHLERWLLGDKILLEDWGEPTRFDQDIRTLRIDFHGSGVVDAADLVLRLRAASAGSARRFAAFDIAFAVWWALARPGTPLPQVHGPVGAELHAQMIDTLNGILSEAGLKLGVGPLTVRMGVHLVNAIRSRQLRSATLRQCAPLAAVIEHAQQDASSYLAATLAGLLSWDLEQLHPAQRPLVVAFADAVEYIQASDRSQERLFNRIVSLTPQILWVVTSRNRLEWDSSDLIGTFPAAGRNVWPELSCDSSDTSRQHVVSDLPDADVIRFLRAASGSNGNPKLSKEVINRIRGGAHGLPLYLDLSVILAREASKTADADLDPATFGNSLPQLVTKVFADLVDAERDAARAASLLPRFDPDIVARAAGVRLGDAERFCTKSLVSRDDHVLFPFRLHDAVRLAIADEPVTSPGAWAPSDRVACAGRLIEALHLRHDQLPGIDHRRDILELIAGLCAAYDLRPLRLSEALTDLPGLDLTATRLPPPNDRTWIGQLSGFFHAWQAGNRQERINYLTRFLSTPHEEDIERLGRRWLAFSLRNIQAHADEALTILQDLLTEEPESQLLRYQVARTLHQLGRYQDITEHLNRYPLSDPSSDARFRSDLAFDRGEIAEAFAGATARASHLRSIGKHRVALENSGVALWRKALARQASIAECDALITQADQHGIKSTMRMALAAKIVCLAGDDRAARDTFAEITTLLSLPAVSPARWREWAAALIHGLYTGDDHRIQEVRRQWDGSNTWSPNRQFIDRIFVYIGYPPTYPPIDIEGEASREIEQRWHAVIDALVRQA